MAHIRAQPAMQNMAEIMASDLDVLRPCDVANVLHVAPYVINLLVKENRCPFPVFKSGNRVKIPRLAFVRWMAGGEALC